MNLQDAIIEEIKNNTLETGMDNDSLASLILYSIANDSYFKNNYNFLTLCEIDENKIKILQPKLSYIRGFTNQSCSQQIVDFFLPQELMEKSKNEEIEEHDDEDFYYEETYPSDIIRTYLNEDTLNDFNTFINIIENNDNIQDISKAISIENEKNKNFIHNIDIHISSNFKKEELEASKLFKMISNSVFLGENSINDELHSRLYYLNDDPKERFYPDSFLYRDCLNLYGIHSLINNGKLKSLSILKGTSEKNALSDYELIHIYKDDKLKKCPPDIHQMINDKEDRKKIYKAFNKKYSSQALDIALSLQSPLNKNNKIINLTLPEIREQAIEQIKECVNKYKKIQLLQDKIDIVQPLVENVKSKFSEFNNPNFTVEVHHTKGINSMWGRLQISDDIEEREKLQIYDNYNSDLYTKGLEMADESGFASGQSNDKIFFIARTENSMIGMLSCTNKENVMEICNISIANYRRNEGVMSKLYNEMAQYAVNNNKVICTSMYTDKGAKYIPSTKKKITQNNPNVLFLSKDSKFEGDFQKEVCSLNDKIMRTLEISNEPINVSKLRKLYDNIIKQFESEFNKIEDGNYMEKYNLNDKMLTMFDNEFKKSLQSKRKQKIS